MINDTIFKKIAEAKEEYTSETRLEAKDVWVSYEAYDCLKNKSSSYFSNNPEDDEYVMGLKVHTSQYLREDNVCVHPIWRR